MKKLKKYKYSFKTIFLTILFFPKVIKLSKLHFDKYKRFCYLYYRTGTNLEGIEVNSLALYYDDIKNKNLNQTFNENEIRDFLIESKEGKISSLVTKNKMSNKWVIGLHGWTENKYLGLRLVHHYWKQGYNILTFDGFAHGLSYGDKTDIGYSSIKMLDSIVRYLIENENAKTIGLIGNSMGASTSILYSQIGEYKNNINWIVADCGFNSIKLQYRYYIENNLYYMPWWKIGFLFTYKFSKETNTPQNKYNLETKMKQANKIPIFFIHAEGDTFIPYEMSKSMFRKKIKFENEKISDIWTPVGSEHVNTISDYNEEYIQRTLTFSRKWDNNET